MSAAISISELQQKMLSQLVYLDIPVDSELYESYTIYGEITIGRLIGYYQSGEGQEKLRQRFKSPEELLEWNSFIQGETVARHQDWKITNIVSHNEKTESGFVAYTFVPEAGQAAVAFRGSEPMEELLYRNDWLNNATSMYAELTVQQQEAKQYMERYMKPYDPITVTGHSLGGNLALSVTVTADEAVRAKIAETITFNAPGFNRTFIDRHQAVISAMAPRMKELQNKYDLVSSILTGLSPPVVIATQSGSQTTFDIGANHALSNFKLDEYGGLARESLQQKADGGQLITALTQALEQVPSPLLQGTVTTLFALIDERIEPVDILAAGAVGLLAPSLPVVMTTAPLAGFAAAGWVLYRIDTIAPAFREAAGRISKAPNVLSNIYQEMVTYTQGLFQQLEKRGLAQLDGFHAFQERVYEEAHRLFSRVSTSFRNRAASGAQSVQAGPIQASVPVIRSVASRLSVLQGKLAVVQQRMDTLSNLVDLEDKLTVRLLGSKIGSGQELRKCKAYLQLAADDLEQCERSIMEHALSI
ncbi:Mbeg1-like protein [Paenibacillus sp. y28]|uniref:Mbeg1-like protein n=1 Tax=Paenibacillus sp. y28 TaxID=3129110 RepID=UPI0030159938